MAEVLQCHPAQPGIFLKEIFGGCNVSRSGLGRHLFSLKRIKPFADALAAAAAASDTTDAAELGVLRWELEELRVSMFAQELGARGGPSPKKMAQRLGLRGG